MKSVEEKWAAVTLSLLLVLLSGCQQQLGPKQKGPYLKPPVAAANIQGDLLYRDVLQKGELVHNVGMPGGAKQVWVGTHNGLYVSAEKGLWGLLSPELAKDDITGWAIRPDNPNQIFLGGVGVHKRSTDGGQTWQDSGEGLPEGADIRCLIGADVHGTYTLYAFVTGLGVYQSLDEGEHWQQWQLIDQEVYDMDYSPVEQRLYVVAQNGLYFNEQGKWVKEELPSVDHVFSLAIEQQSGNLFISTNQGIWERKGAKWSKVPLQTPEQMVVISEGTGEHRLVGIGESAFIYTLLNDSWLKWE